MSGICRHHGYRSQLADGRMCPSGWSWTAFSMAELMVAIGILGIGIVIIAGAFPVAIDQSREAIELSTSQMVFNEAVNQLKTRFTWTELEALIGQTDPNMHVANNTTNVWSLIGPYTFGDKRYDSSGDSNIPIYVYSMDNTYGWLAGIQKVPSIPKCYRIWIFVLREPTSVRDGIAFKFVWIRNPNVAPYPTPAATLNPSKVLKFPASATSPFPGKGVSFLANNGELYRILDAGEPSGNDVNLSCDKQVSDGITDNDSNNTFNDVGQIAYPGRAQPNYQMTRKNPVVAVYQTVISY